MESGTRVLKAGARAYEHYFSECMLKAVWSEMAPNAKPAMTPVRAYELFQTGLLIQADCIAMTAS